MENSKLMLALLAVLLIFEAEAQIFVGEVMYRGQHEYLKLNCTNDSCTVSLPYLDGRRKYQPTASPLQGEQWSIDRGTEYWHFQTSLSENGVDGKLVLPTGEQPLRLHRQQEAVPEEALSRYEGIYEDERGRRAVIYARFGYLHLMSPYSEQTVSLKPVGENAFWSVSGEFSVFENLEGDTYGRLQLQDRWDQGHSLLRRPSLRMEEVWIEVAGDSLFGRLFLPAGTAPAPACLLLPGGGGPSQIENMTYEARFLAASGMVCLVFDKGGVGLSRGTRFEQFTFEEKAKRYEQVFHYLARHPRVDPGRIGIHGPSEGGRLALMMAEDMPDSVAFVNATAAPLMSLREGQLYAAAHHHRGMGVSEVDILSIQGIWNRYYDGIMAGKIDSSDFREIRRLTQVYDRLFLPPLSDVVPLSPKAEDLRNDRVVQAAGKIKCPVLLQYGENDQRVNPYRSLQNFFPQLPADHQVAVILYPRGNHAMMTPEFQICTGYANDKVNWLKKIGLLEH